VYRGAPGAVRGSFRVIQHCANLAPRFAAQHATKRLGDHSMKLFPALAVALALCAFSTVPLTADAQASPATSCSPVGDLSFVCGLINVEDFLPVDGGRWLVGGSFQGSAGLYLIDTAAKTAKPATLSIAAKPEAIYHECPGAPDLKKLATH